MFLERAVVGAGLEQRLPHRGADHAHERRAARPARARPGTRRGRADARSGRGRRAARDARDRRAAGARRGRQGAECDRACGAHAQPAHSGGRQGVVRAACVEHGLVAWAARAPASAAVCRWSRAWRSSRPSGSIAKPQRALDKQAGSVLEWQQYTADALVTLARQRQRTTTDGIKRSPTTLIVHLSEDAPPLLEGAGPLSPETAERLTCDARRLTIKPTRA